MGSLRHTPFPYLWDFGQMICACSMIPTAFYLKKVFTTYSEKEGEKREYSKIRLVLNYFSFLSILITLLGMFMVGLFSEDRTTELHLHGWFSYVVWSGFAATSFFLGLLITFYPSPFPRALGPYMVVLPPIACTIFLTTFNIFSEWILMFSLMGWIIPVALIMLKYINNEIASIK